MFIYLLINLTFFPDFGCFVRVLLGFFIGAARRLAVRFMVTFLIDKRELCHQN